MNCPSCQTLLTTIDYETVEIETCLGCGGEWLDKDELGKIVRIREEKFDEEERRAIAESATITGVDLEKADRDLVCPKCGCTTDAINYGGDTGIVLDRCTGCGGFWLDKDEIEKVQMLVEGWEDLLPEDLKKHGAKLREIEITAQEDDVDVAKMKRLPWAGRFVNTLINGILDLSV